MTRDAVNARRKEIAAGKRKAMTEEDRKRARARRKELYWNMKGRCMPMPFSHDGGTPMDQSMRGIELTPSALVEGLSLSTAVVHCSSGSTAFLSDRTNMNLDEIITSSNVGHFNSERSGTGVQHHAPTTKFVSEGEMLLDEQLEYASDDRDKIRNKRRTQHRRRVQACCSVVGYEDIVHSADLLLEATFCKNCGAKRFYHEPKAFCCSNGSVSLVDNVVPPEIYELFTSSTDETIEFLKYVRTYNTNFTFTSFVVKCDRNLNTGNRGVYTFRVQGQIYHYINNLLPNEDDPSFLQLYFYDTNHEVQNRMQCSDRMSERILETLIQVLAINPYATFFRTLEQRANLQHHVVRIVSTVSLDQRVFNILTTSQVATVWVDENFCAQPTKQDIIVYNHMGGSQRINYYFGCFDPLQYPLLFPFGNVGWHQGIPKKEIATNRALPNSYLTPHPSPSITVDDLIEHEEESCSFWSF